MRLGSRSECAAASLQRSRPRSSAPRDPKGRPVAGAQWPRCRAQSAAHSCSRSTGKTRPGVRWTGGCTASACQAESLAVRGGARLRPEERWSRSPCDGAPERAMARAPGSASSSWKIPALLLVLSHQRPFSKQPLQPPPQPRLSRAALGVLTGGQDRECEERRISYAEHTTEFLINCFLL